MKDKIYNHYLSIKNFFMILFKIKALFTKKGISIKISNYFDNENYTMQNFVAEYYLGPTWGLYHPDNFNQWYDKSAVNLGKDGLKLSITNHEYQYDTSFNDTIKNGIGMVISKNSYSYGLFEWNIILPKGKHLWPAIWLTHTETWPPEIDILEAYSNSKMKYRNRCNTNIHYGLKDNKKTTKAMSHGFIVNDSEILNLKLDWTMEYIRIYYNNYLVRQITDKKVLSWFNTVPVMKMIMNNAIAKPSSDILEMNVSPLIIKNFNYSN